MVYEQHGLSEGDFDVLATLRRSGASHAVQPAELARTTMITSGGLTKRIDRLEEAGLVERTRLVGGDGRTKRVQLTPKGKACIDTAFTDHMANETRLVNQLASSDQAALEAILRTWLTHHEDPTS